MKSTSATRVLLSACLWGLTALEALGMGAVGAAKFAGDTWPLMFQGWGYPVAFTYVVGVAEVCGALALLVPRLASYGAAVLIAVMIGAILTLVTTSYETDMGLGGPIIHIAVLAILLRARWSSRWRSGTEA